MKKSTKAVLLSALLFPGAGHLFLKKYFFGAVLTGTALIALYILIPGLIDRARQISEKILNGEIRLDLTVITELASQQPIGGEAQSLEMAMSVLVIAWLAGIIGSYLAGRSFESGAKTL
ncbi:MAG: hypothetical protein COB94_006325 [Gammaproteobacteria bacterium]|nr:hypothetical protein [Gammaproteobacteria bacterium]